MTRDRHNCGGLLGDDADESYLSSGWESPSDATERILQGFHGSPADDELAREVRRALDEAEIKYLRVEVTYDHDRNGGIHVTLADGTEVTYP